MTLLNKKMIFNIALSSLMLLISQSQVIAVTPINTDADKIDVSVNKEDFKNQEASIIEKFSLKNKFKRSPEAQVKSFMKKFNKYSEMNKIDKLEELYSDSYVNNDGFDKKSIFELMKEASELYKNIKYNTQIKEIKINGSNAKVSIYETAKGETLKEIEKFNGNGILESEMYYTNYLRKEDGEWKLLATDVRKETVSIKYGDAKSINVEMNSPEYVPAGSEYEVSVKLNSCATKIPVKDEENLELESVSPDGVFIVGSITNDQIKYPQDSGKDVLRAVKSDELARILKTNKDGYNEYATASLGITRVLLEPPSVSIKMSGMVIIMNRINVFPIKATYTQEKEKKNAVKKI